MHTFLRTTIYGLIAVSSLIFGTQARANEAVPGKSLKPNKLKAKRLKAKSAASNMTMLGWLEIKNRESHATRPYTARDADECEPHGSLKDAYTRFYIIWSVRYNPINKFFKY